MHGETREGPNGEPEIWVNLGDVVDWLAELPSHTEYAEAGKAALEIRELLFAAVDNAELIRKGDG
jgi:hypothetical protein